MLYRIRRHERLRAPELLQSAVADVASESEGEDDDEMDDAEIERRRAAVRERAAKRRQEEEVELMQVWVSDVYFATRCNVTRFVTSNGSLC